MPARLVIALVGLWPLLAAVGGSLSASDSAQTEFFESKVRPILVERCFECHSGQLDKPKGGLRLDSRAALLKGGDTGPAVVPGKPKESLLVDAINYGELYQMPPKSRLPAEEVAVLTKWVETGAHWPAAGSQEPVGSSRGAGVRSQESEREFDLVRRKAEHWCWQPIREVAPPPVSNESWIREPLDRFILARLEERGLAPSPPADERTLVRRAYFDLTGLPPSAAELQELASYESSPPLPLSLAPPLRPTPLPLSRSSANDGERARQGEWERAYAALVDRLLASPRFGERWGRHWLDLVRYAESRGHEFDYTIPNAFEYRDYVIRALNADLPYDQFLLEHIAGDLLPAPRLDPVAGFNESIIGTGFWFLGEWCHSPVDIRKDECDRLDNMIDVFSKTFLGVTVACARCHDHKFDCVSQRDYYALAGYLQSSSYRLARFETWQHDRALAAERAALDRRYRAKLTAAIAAALSPQLDQLAEKLAGELASLKDALGVSETDLRGGQAIVDYAHAPPEDWMTDGPLFGSGPVRPGQIVLTGDPAAPLDVATDGAARRDWFWGDFALGERSENDSGRLAGWLRAGQTLKTPTFRLASGKLHYLIEGVGHVYAVVDSHTMINGPLHAELLKETGGNSDLPMRWITHDLSRYTGHRLHLEFTPGEGEDFRILRVVDGSERPAAPEMRPNRWIERVLAAADSNAAGTRTSVCRELLRETLELLAADRIADDDQPRDRAALANWLIGQAATDEQSPAGRFAAEYAAALDELGKKIRPASRLCLAMWEGTPVDENVLIRGNHRTVGPVVPRGLPEALVVVEQSGDVSAGPPSSGRLEMAQQLIDPRNPLVSRVIVNRVWQHLMGRGIVPSVDNFGVLGQPPTHPELLDYLAAEFMRDGWSIKRLVRRIMLSSTYRQASSIAEFGLRNAERQQDAAATALHSALRTSQYHDPENLLFHRQTIKRLEGEAIRDSILAISGRLDLAIYGPSVPIYLTPFMQGRGRPKESGPLDGAGRRSIYVAVRRNFLSPMMLAFDTPIPFTTIGRRNVSNVPAQALILMNDPFVAEQARRWAQSVLANPGDSDSSQERVRRMYLAAFGREPAAAELQAALAFLKQQASAYGPSPAADRDDRAWADLAHVLLNVKELLFVE